MGSFGLMQDRQAAWRARLFYRMRGKVMILCGADRRCRHMLVPVDLSVATGLVLVFLQQNYLTRLNFGFRFVHAAKSDSAGIQAQWREWLEISGIGRPLPLEVIPSAGRIADTLAECLRAGRHGTVVMGKRGGSGIKKWMPGSVSYGVFKNLDDQTLMIVD